MSREIKFRAWDKQNKKWFQPRIKGKVRSENEYTDYCQYTGLKDKDGKEIYENDVVMIPDWIDRGDGNCDEEIFKVFFNQGYASFMIADFGDLTPTEFLHEYHLDCKVISNIYEILPFRRTKQHPEQGVDY